MAGMTVDQVQLTTSCCRRRRNHHHKHDSPRRRSTFLQSKLSLLTFFLLVISITDKGADAFSPSFNTRHRSIRRIRTAGSTSSGGGRSGRRGLSLTTRPLPGHRRHILLRPTTTGPSLQSSLHSKAQSSDDSEDDAKPSKFLKNIFSKGSKKRNSPSPDEAVPPPEEQNTLPTSSNDSEENSDQVINEVDGGTSSFEKTDGDMGIAADDLPASPSSNEDDGGSGGVDKETNAEEETLLPPPDKNGLKVEDNKPFLDSSKQQEEIEASDATDAAGSPEPKSKPINRRRQEAFDDTSLSVSFPTVQSDELKEDLKSSDDKKKPEKKKKKSLIVRMIRFTALLGALIAVAPFITEEVEEYLIVPSSSEQVEAKGRSENEKESDDTTIEQDDTDNSAATGVPQKDKTSEGATSPILGRLLPKRSNSHPDTPQTKFSPETESSQNNNLSIQEKQRLALSFVTDVVNQIGPCVVRVDTETHYVVDGESTSLQNSESIQQGQGSGLIVSNDGCIVTNAHVIEDATQVTVTLTDGRVFAAQVLGMDEIVDLAVLKIDSSSSTDEVKNLPVATLGDSDALSVGRIVIAVGSPGGLDNTVTMGIVSGLERSSTMVGIPHKKVDYVQTDAAINPGNSGGPLVDVESGQVIGINAAIRAHMEGTSFAIPSNKVNDILPMLKAGKQVHHGYLGLGLATCSPEWAKQQQGNIPALQGALVTKVFRRTPAERGGLKEGDVLLEIGGQTVSSADDARRCIDQAPVDTNLSIVLQRGNRKLTVTVKPVDLSARLREMRHERRQQSMQERLRFEELGPFRSMIQ